MITVYCQDKHGKFNVRTSNKWQDALADAEELSQQLASSWPDDVKERRGFTVLEPDAEGVYIGYQIKQAQFEADGIYEVWVCIEGQEDADVDG